MSIGAWRDYPSWGFANLAVAPGFDIYVVYDTVLAYHAWDTSDELQAFLKSPDILYHDEGYVIYKDPTAGPQR